MHNTELSIAIPYHQNLDYLAQTLQSIRTQTVLPEALIIIDNSELGEAETLLADFPCKVVYVRSESGLGLAHYFNQCLDATTTRFCTIAHSDDLLLPTYVETMSAAAQENVGAALTFCKTTAIDVQGKALLSFKDWAKQYLWPRGIVQGEKGLRALLRANFIMCPTVCYNLPVLGIRRFDGKWRYLLDLELYGRLLLQGEYFSGVRHVLYACRRHPEATTSIYERNFQMFTEGARCIQHLALQAGQKGWHSAARAGKQKAIYSLYVLLRVAHNMRSQNAMDSFKFLVRYIMMAFKMQWER